jgi:uncharacterized protein (TIGR02466 family)
MNTPKLIDVNPFEPLIIKTHYDGFDWEKLEPICENLIKESKGLSYLEHGKAASSVSNQNYPHTLPEFKEFYNWLSPIVNHIIKNEWDLFAGYDYGFMKSWVNYHDNTGLTTEHHHGQTILVVATYLNLPKNGGFIQFKNPLEHYKGFTLHNKNEELWMWKTVPAKTGDVIIFPGWMRHRTEPNKSDERRWVLTTNFTNLIPQIKK